MRRETIQKRNLAFLHASSAPSAVKDFEFSWRPLCLWRLIRLFKPQRQINRLDIFGQTADGDSIHSSFGNRPHVVQINTSRGFELGALGGDAHRFAQLLKSEIVEQDQFRAAIQRFLQLLQIFHFDLN